MKKLLITLDDDEEKLLEKRAKSNMMTLQEQVEDIIRRSCVNTKKAAAQPKDNIDDALVKVFSRQNTGRPRKR